MTYPFAPYLLALSGLACLLVGFSPMRGDLWQAWQMDEYSHGMLIPFLAVLLGAHRLKEHQPKLAPSWWFAPVLLLGAAGLVVGSLAAFQAAAHYGFILCVAALSLAFLGTHATWVLLPAIFYLWFAVPLPHLFQASLSQDLQLLSSTLGVGVLQLLQVSVYQEGNIIDLGAYRLQVVDACSGLRYLFPLISFGYLAACIMQGERWKRLLVVLSAIPITIFMNSLRIALIGITVSLWGQEMAEGLVHEFEGWVVFALCALLLLGEMRLLGRVGKPSRIRMEYFSLPQPPVLRQPLRISPPALLASAGCVALAVLGAGNLLERRDVIPDHPPLASFPAQLEEWRGKDSTLPADVLEGLQLTDYLLADYEKPGASPVNLYIAYYDRQRVGSSTHSPSHCIPAGGWQVKSGGVGEVPRPNAEPLRVTRMLITRGDVRQLVYFWFSERGRNLTQTTYAKWYLLVDSIMLGRTDGALIRLVTPVAGDETEQQADARLAEFIAVAGPEISRMLPGRSLPQPSNEMAPNE